MTREEAIKVLDEDLKQRSDGYHSYLAHYGKQDKAEEEFLDSLYMAISALREQPRWISVEERLPSGWWIDPDTGYREPEEYIVFVKGATSPTFANFIDGKFMRPDAFYRGDGNGNGFADEITHWMPLPEPPEVGV